LLLSSPGVLGRVAFLRHELILHLQLQQATAAAAAADKATVEAAGEAAADDGAVDAEAAAVVVEASTAGQQQRSFPCLPVPQVKAAIMAPRAKFFATHHPRYEAFLTEALLQRGSRQSGVGKGVPQDSWGSEVRTYTAERLEKAHGALLLQETLI
jgi:hypothetical protein